MSDRSGTKRRATYDDLRKVPESMVAEIVDGETLDRVRKLAVYARERVAHAWLVSPSARTLEILRLEGERWVFAASHGGEETVRAEPFEAVAIELPAVWGE